MTDNVTETEPAAETVGLRERNRNRTMDAIAEAFSELSIVNPRFTMQELADAAGISVRTLYRYYPNREELISGLYDLINRHMSERQISGEGLPRRTTESRIPHSFRVFHDNDALMRAVVINRMSGEVADPDHGRRADNIHAGVQEIYTDLPEVAQRQIAGLIRLIGGSVSWFTLTDGAIPLDHEEAAGAVAWAVRVLLDAAQNEREELS